MAFISRTARQTFRLLANPRLHFERNIKPNVCFISTSKKNKDSATLEHPFARPEVEDSLEAKDENWISYGYSYTDRAEDEWAHHFILLVSVTFCLIGGSYLLAYYPDMKARNWSQREGYLELERRRREGLPLIDANFVSPEKIELPSEEELGEDFKIII